MTKEENFGVGTDDLGRAVFHIKINGFTLSMNIGTGGYNDNRDAPRRRRLDGVTTSSTAECAVVYKDAVTGKTTFVTRQFFPVNDNVAGWQNSEQIKEAILKIIAAKSPVISA